MLATTVSKLLSSKRASLVLALSFSVFVACQTQVKQQLHPEESQRVTTLHPEQSKPISAEPQPEPTNVEMRNVILRDISNLSLRVQWMRGQLRPTRSQDVPSFDDSSSYFVQIEAGVIRVNLSELTVLLNKQALPGSGLQKVSVAVRNQRLQIKGTLHKGIPLHVEMMASLGTTSDGKICLHAEKLHVLRMPMSGLLKTFHITLDDLVRSNPAKGLEIAGNDIYLDQEKLLPPPLKKGRLTALQLSSAGEIVETYGSAQASKPAKPWRNYMSMQGGTFNFGKFTMHRVDMALVDSDNDQWFDFDGTRFQEQLVNGNAHLTPEAGLEVFMPDISRIPDTPANRSIRATWMKNRYRSSSSMSQ